jgi:hypothetical protein
MTFIKLTVRLFILERDTSHEPNGPTLKNYSIANQKVVKKSDDPDLTNLKKKKAGL